MTESVASIIQPLWGPATDGVALQPVARSAAPIQEPFTATPARIEQEISQAMQVTLSPALADWVSRYEAVGHRTGYLWIWCRHAVEVTTLPCASPTLRDDLCDTKVLGVMLDVLLDDVADRQGDAAFLNYLLDIPSSRPSVDAAVFSTKEQEYAEFATEVWREIQSRAEQLPRQAEFADLLCYDYSQVFNAMRYAFLLNRTPALLNLIEHDLYLPHNMHMMVSATLDLMASPKFDLDELGRLREAIWHAQYMGRIGNLVTTWQRELGDKDFTSGVYAHAAASGALTPRDLAAGDQDRIRETIEAGDHEAYFHRAWQDHRRFMLAAAPHLRSVDLERLVAGLERLICLHLGSRGKK